MAVDIYQDVESLSDDLRTVGEAQWSKKLDEAMSISGHWGEVMGAMRLQLRSLRQSDVAQRYHLQDRIDIMLEYLDDVLGPLPSAWKST